MDNMITGSIAVAIFMAFVIGLAVSIKEIPFALIVTAVCVMLLIDFFQSVKEALAKAKENKL